MHTLDMVLGSVDIADTVTVCERADSGINVEYSDRSVPAGGDSVSKAVRALQKRFGEFGADIYVEKRIPMAAGLGGSGVDAAAALRAYGLLYDINENGTDLDALALSVGSDVPYLLRGGFARVTGTGGRCAFFMDPACAQAEKAACEFYLVIAKGAGGVLSKDAYRVFDEMYQDRRFCPSDNARLTAALLNRDRTAAYRQMDNALLQPALSLNLGIRNTLDALNDAGAVKTVMTGSGAACAGFFTGMDQAERAARALCGRGLWAKAVTTRQKGISIL